MPSRRLSTPLAVCLPDAKSMAASSNALLRSAQVGLFIGSKTCERSRIDSARPLSSGKARSNEEKRRYQYDGSHCCCLQVAAPRADPGRQKTFRLMAWYMMLDAA